MISEKDINMITEEEVVDLTKITKEKLKEKAQLYYLFLKRSQGAHDVINDIVDIEHKSKQKINNPVLEHLIGSLTEKMQKDKKELSLKMLESIAGAFTIQTYFSRFIHYAIEEGINIEGVSFELTPIACPSSKDHNHYIINIKIDELELVFIDLVNTNYFGELNNHETRN